MLGIYSRIRPRMVALGQRFASLRQRVRGAAQSLARIGHRYFPWLAHRRSGREGLATLREEFTGPYKAAASESALRVIIINHWYDQEIEAFAQAGVDCEIHVLTWQMLRGVRPFFPADLAGLPCTQGGTGACVESDSEPMRRRKKVARRHFLRNAVGFLIERARPHAVLSPTDTPWYIRLFLEEFREQGIPVVVQDKEGTPSHGPLNKEWMAVSMRCWPPLGDRYYYWGDKQVECFTRAGQDPARIRVFGSPRSDYFLHPERHVSRTALGLPEKKLVTCFTFEGDAYLPTLLANYDFGRPWKQLRQEMHAMLVQVTHARPDVQFVVKCHPQSQEGSEILDELAGAGDNLKVMYGAAVASALIVNSSVVIGFQSTTLTETMLTSTPILYCGWTEAPERFADLLVPFPSSGACFLPRSKEQFKEMLLDLIDSRLTVTADQFQKRRSFVSQYMAAVDGRVCERILRDIATEIAHLTGCPSLPSAAA